MDKLGQEWVSAAVDGETDVQTMAELAADTHSHNKWRNYHLIGDAMRGELPQTMAFDLSASIAAAIDLEPAIVSPQVTAPEVTTVPQQVAVNEGQSRVVPLFKQFGQYAIAATVAMFAIVGVQNFNQTADDATSPSPVLITRPLVGSASPVSLQTGPVQQNQSYTNDQMNEQRRRINTYIQDHMLQQRLNTGAVVEDNSEVIPVPVNQ
ncbi:sigma-E factor negative regulatory protein RseA [Shewanella oneidensis MR-1]|uniref:Anti-sigma-E factor RseA n=1 Tax=Shewanella oneidensis (strain ATCC 700550 / JCM 31522 / CIP 106686 / LMG 19005 / NCIMB 14063 / MR-1) TaxID=211586 RepID=Q8EH86_SHEON|nr:sigma-E factor negative regulatory protein RseA [Shewanella oneidensis]AAN54408.1 sigma-E factor negative regulatory protein RseA [Shewanella oneidensis MR-1]MDX5996821.1 sigma-E factor negative regulatory protein RseA [Shewanella oneidensis]MEE2026537.1 Anti-sigma-E factor RseA [Shewanella oneidensis]QKG96102.1 sigma-E factor negative regulatory protein RseA [Shewanella oneidensis MR-1]